MDSAEGQEYWAAMNLMGDYAAANHAVLHRNVMDRIGAKAIAGVENHHNFAWKETHGGREVIVHRKGATPAGAGVLGVIPGSMADPAFVVRGKGNAESLDSASHGAGRRMSRTKAKAKYAFGTVRKTLAKRGRAGDLRGVRRGPRRLQKHPPSDGRADGSGRRRRPLRPPRRQDVRRRVPGGGLTVRGSKPRDSYPSASSMSHRHPSPFTPSHPVGYFGVRFRSNSRTQMLRKLIGLPWS